MKKEVKRKKTNNEKEIDFGTHSECIRYCKLCFCTKRTVPPARIYSVDNPQDNTNQVKGPLAPATLLLLGLAGSFAGVKIYQNNKKEE